MDEAKEKFFQCHDDTKTAFEELCAMVDALNVSTRKMFYKGHLIRATLETSVVGVLYLGPSLVRLKI